jgi:hypothetical protein
MTRLTLTLAVGATALALPAAALAKGPSAATISGPGLSKSLSFTGSGEASGTVLGNLTLYAGFFPATFGQEPDPMLHARPKGKLGARFTIHYLVPGPDSTAFHVTQQLYPYARGGAVTYLKPGQPIFDIRTRGGWYPAGPALKQLLVRAGLSRTAPQASSNRLGLYAGIGVPGALVLTGTALMLARRRRRATG